jgi:hypothetical protein
VTDNQNSLARAPSLLAVDHTKLQNCKLGGMQAAAKLATLPCTSPDHEQAFADFLQRTQVILQDLESERETLVRPLIDDKSMIDGLHKEARKPWEDVKATCKAKIAGAQLARKKAQDEARALAAEAARGGNTEACVVALSQVQENSKPEGAAVSWEWHAMILDTRELPRDWLVIDESKVKRYCKDHAKSETIPNVPGLRFERRANVRVT